MSLVYIPFDHQHIFISPSHYIDTALITTSLHDCSSFYWSLFCSYCYPSPPHSTLYQPFFANTLYHLKKWEKQFLLCSEKVLSNVLCLVFQIHSSFISVSLFALSCTTPLHTPHVLNTKSIHAKSLIPAMHASTFLTLLILFLCLEFFFLNVFTSLTLCHPSKSSTNVSFSLKPACPVLSM